MSKYLAVFDECGVLYDGIPGDNLEELADRAALIYRQEDGLYRFHDDEQDCGICDTETGELIARLYHEENAEGVPFALAWHDGEVDGRQVPEAPAATAEERCPACGLPTTICVCVPVD